MVMRVATDAKEHLGRVIGPAWNSGARTAG